MNQTVQQFPIEREQVSGLLEMHDILPTQQRIDIAWLLFQRPQHVAAEQVLAQVNTHCGHVSKATVYNTLGLFVRKGLVREVLIEPGRTFYDTNTRDHHHLYNVDTGELSDIPVSSVQVSGEPVVPDGAEIEGVDVVIRVRNRAGADERD